MTCNDFMCHCEGCTIYRNATSAIAGFATEVGVDCGLTANQMLNALAMALEHYELETADFHDLDDCDEECVA